MARKKENRSRGNPRREKKAKDSERNKREKKVNNSDTKEKRSGNAASTRGKTPENRRGGKSAAEAKEEKIRGSGERTASSRQKPEKEKIDDFQAKGGDELLNALSEEVGQRRRQTESIIVFTVAVIVLLIISIPSDNLWNLLRTGIFGILGNMVFLWDAFLFYIGYMLYKKKDTTRTAEIIRSIPVIFILLDVLFYILFEYDNYRLDDGSIDGGILHMLSSIFLNGIELGHSGLLGGGLGELLCLAVGKIGAVLITVVLIVAFLLLLVHTNPLELLDKVSSAFRGGKRDSEQSGFNEDDYEIIADEYDRSAGAAAAQPSVGDSANAEVVVDAVQSADAKPSDSAMDNPISAIVSRATRSAKKKNRAEEIEERKDEVAREVSSGYNTSDGDYKYPSVKMLIPPTNSAEANDAGELKETAQKLISTLGEYGVKVSISHISRGPTVTRYEVIPAPGVKINKITNLSNDIALRLAARSIRIEAPIPGKPAVGIEIPNKTKQMVRIREIIGSKQFSEATGALTVALGKDIEGGIVLCDLSKMPHLLIAGSTGSGKSVCVNSMLISLLYKYTPQEVKMVLIDPKAVEFDMYNGIPHLLVPVVSDPRKAAGALQWAVDEMHKRYGMLKERGARNVDNYNKIAEETGEFEKLCRIVIVIDEMADLMIASPKEVEDSIARLAAMARAAGMHMILATQRPSVDVITGTIKNNIPSRIALAVSSQIDSRTILDEGGAENLIGYGDMLYHPMGSSLHTRVQCCFVDDREVERVINFIKQNGLAEYDESISEEIERNALDSSGNNSEDISDKDPRFMEAVDIVTELGQASTSMLQRKLSVGYARAGRLMDQLEKSGIVGPSEGSKPREVLITRAQWLEMSMNKAPAAREDSVIRENSRFAAQTLAVGHEDISARQSEFFNGESAEEAEEYLEDSEQSVEQPSEQQSAAESTDAEVEESDVPPWESIKDYLSKTHVEFESTDDVGNYNARRRPN